VRAFGLDVDRDFCEVAIAEDGEVRSAARLPTRVAALELFAQSLVASDVVALEATTGADKIVALLQARGIRVVVANTRKLKSITEAKATTDRLDARTLARLLVSGLLDEVWTPDERTRTLRHGGWVRRPQRCSRENGLLDRRGCSSVVSARLGQILAYPICVVRSGGNGRLRRWQCPAGQAEVSVARPTNSDTTGPSRASVG
jgi:Transposase